MELLVELALILAVGGVGGVDVAVATFELFVDGALLDGAGADVVGEDAEEKGVGRGKVAE